MEGRAGNSKGLYLSSSVNDRGQNLGHFRVGSAVVSLGVLSAIPQTNSKRFGSPLANERNLVLEAFLFSQQGNYFVVKFLGELGDGIGLQMQVHSACKHGALSFNTMPKGYSR